MTSELQSDVLNQTAIDEIVYRAQSLYSLPAVAAKVIELTQHPRVDALALKECIQADPALTAKILRVVNSSLFGLSREVCDLNQAIALLGTKPLKLLVLGFSLPERLFSAAARDQLEWYWSTTLSRAVAAREISEQLFERSGDDAFLAGLLQDIGVLVLLCELKEPYSTFLSRVIDEHVDLQRLENESLGFDHITLSARLLEHWKMPEILVNSISKARFEGDSGTGGYQSSSKPLNPSSELARILHLAGLVAELVGHNRLSILPELLEVGDAYCGLDKDKLKELVALLQPKVQQLAEVLSLELPQGTDYVTILTDAHQQMSAIAQSVVGMLTRSESNDHQMCVDMAESVDQLQTAVDDLLHRPKQATGDICGDNDSQSLFVNDGAGEISHAVGPPVPDSGTPADGFANHLAEAVRQCRMNHQPISLLLIDRTSDNSEDYRVRQIVDHVLASLQREESYPDIVVEQLTAGRHALILPGCERHQAVQLAEEIFCHVDKARSHLNQSEASLNNFLSAGVASVSMPPKNFLPSNLIETAERCLAAAASNGNHAVKSLEIF